MSTIFELAKMNGAGGVAELIEETSRAIPEVARSDNRTIRGVVYKQLVRTALGTAQGGSFRDANAGATAQRHTYENRTVECFIMEPRIEADVAIADGYEDGPEAYMAMQASGTLEGEFQGLARCFYYGNNATLGNAKAFPGLIQLHDATNMVVDANGTTADTGSSVWLVKWGPKACQWVWGNGRVLQLDPPRKESIVDPADSTKKYTGWVQTGLGRPGLQMANMRSVVRIKKLTADSGKGLTDKLINDALALFPAGDGPDVIYMSKRSAVQLAAARTATTPTGAPAPIATTITGLSGQSIPVAITEAILNTEPLTL